MKRTQLQLIELRNRSDRFRLDDKTRAIGKAGVAAAREAVRQAAVRERVERPKAA